MENCTINDMRNMEFDKNVRPLKFIDGTSEFYIADWTELSLAFVNWLIQKGYLAKDKLPVPNHANRGKYFINSVPSHKYPEKDGYWHHIGGYHVDTKYNAQAHVNNIISALKHLGVYSPSFKITFARH